MVKFPLCRYGVEIVLFSPLKRAIETGLLATQQCRGKRFGKAPKMLVCGHAKEMPFSELCNTPSSEEDLKAWLLNAPHLRTTRVQDLCALEEAVGCYPGTGSIAEALRAAEAYKRDPAGAKAESKDGGIAFSEWKHSYMEYREGPRKIYFYRET